MSRQWLPQDEWKVLLPNKLPGYISWEKYLKNRERLRDNRSRPDTPGTPRGSSALLAGLLVCGCGRQLRVRYNGRGEQGGFYVCDGASNKTKQDTDLLAGRWAVAHAGPLGAPYLHSGNRSCATACVLSGPEPNRGKIMFVGLRLDASVGRHTQAV
jgi:hypothetical protein